jgi:hypothetical protein
LRLKRRRPLTEQEAEAQASDLIQLRLILASRYTYPGEFQLIDPG